MEPLRPVSLEVSTPEVRPASGRSAPSGFADELGRALGSADQLQADADRQAGEVALGGGNLHEASLALEKADVAMRLLTKVRNKLVDAYQEVMRMSV